MQGLKLPKLFYQDNISHLFYPEYNRKIEVSKVKIVRTYFLSTLKSSKKRARSIRGTLYERTNFERKEILLN